MCHKATSFLRRSRTRSLTACGSPVSRHWRPWPGRCSSGIGAALRGRLSHGRLGVGLPESPWGKPWPTAVKVEDSLDVWSVAAAHQHDPAAQCLGLPTPEAWQPRAFAAGVFSGFLAVEDRQTDSRLVRGSPVHAVLLGGWPERAVVIGRKQAKAWPERVRTEPDRVSARRSIDRHTETRPSPRSNRGRQHWGRVMRASLP